MLSSTLPTRQLVHQRPATKVAAQLSGTDSSRRFQESDQVTLEASDERAGARAKEGSFLGRHPRALAGAALGIATGAAVGLTGGALGAVAGLVAAPVFGWIGAIGGMTWGVKAAIRGFLKGPGGIAAVIFAVPAAAVGGVALGGTAGLLLGGMLGGMGGAAGGVMGAAAVGLTLGTVGASIGHLADRRDAQAGSSNSSQDLSGPWMAARILAALVGKDWLFTG